jgi:hypothetical protein
VKRSLPVVSSVVAGALVVTAYAVATGKPTPKVGPPPPQLYATVGPAHQIVLADAHGERVVKLKSGWYTLTISDRSLAQRFRLAGPGINRSTAAKFEGAAIWGIDLRKGTYRYATVGPVVISRTFSVS